MNVFESSVPWPSQTSETLTKQKENQNDEETSANPNDVDSEI